MFLGVFNELKIVRQTDNGLYLEDVYGEEVLLPNNDMPGHFEIGQMMDVFVYLDHAERKTATTIQPKIELEKFALLRCTTVNDIGAFMDWGLQKELFVPFKEQKAKMEEGRSYIVRLEYDEESDRLFASNRLERLIRNDELKVEEGDEVDLIIMKRTDLGFTVIVNHKYRGLIFENEIFQELNIGDTLKGFVKKIREENKLDISLRPIGYDNSISGDSQVVLDAIKSSGGRLPLNDKSSPEEIYAALSMSKKAFKRSLGALYKAKIITIEEKAVKLV